MYQSILAAVLVLIYVSLIKADTCANNATCEVRFYSDAGALCGRVRRAEDGSQYASFRGIPYGKPPVGERRFSKLEAMDPWDGDRDATEDSAACPQMELLFGGLTLRMKGMSEDCIYLNLHVPIDALPKESEHVETGLPILVFIHGGSFQVGGGLTDMYGPEYMMTKEVIVITFNYRLNVFGFLYMNHTLLPGNQGLRDMVTLLKWVQRNARAFGGDPDDVTFMAQSAGASAVHLLSMSTAAEGLFNKLIMMSGTAVPNFFAITPTFALAVTALFLSQLNITSSEPEYVHQQLIHMPLVNIMWANSYVQNAYGVISFPPVIEETELANVIRIVDRNPMDLIAEGRGSQYPLLIGSTDKETVTMKWYCINLQMMSRFEQDPTILLPLRFSEMPPENRTALAAILNAKCFNGSYTLDNLIECIGHIFFKYPAMKVAQWRAKGGAPVYHYRYTYRSERSLIKEALWTPYEGAAHFEDLTYVFRVNSMLSPEEVAYPPKNNDDRMRAWMPTLITNFMRCGNPTCSEDQSLWPPMSSKETLQYQLITEPMVYQMSNYITEDTEYIAVIDSIDEESRTVTSRLGLP